MTSWIFLLTGLVILVFWMFQKLNDSGKTTGGESAVDILKKRYARGEISKKEYEEKMRDLSNQ